MLVKYLSCELICFGNIFRKTWIKTPWEWYLSFHQVKKSPTEEQHEILYEMGLYSTYWIHISIENKTPLRNVSSEEWLHAERTRLLRTFCPRSFTHFPWGVQLFLWPSASPNKRKGWVTAYLVMKGLQETSLPETPTATHPSTRLPHWQWLPSNAHQAHLLSQRKSTDVAKISTSSPSWFPHSMSCPKWPPNQLRSQNGKRSTHQHSLKKSTITDMQRMWSKTPRGCLKPQRVLHPTYTVLAHTYMPMIKFSL